MNHYFGGNRSVGTPRTRVVTMGSKYRGPELTDAADISLGRRAILSYEIYELRWYIYFEAWLLRGVEDDNDCDVLRMEIFVITTPVGRRR